MQVGLLGEQLWTSGDPVPVHVVAVHPGWLWFTQAPLGHWLSLVHQHSVVALLHSPAAGHVLAWVVMGGSVVGLTQPRSSRFVEMPWTEPHWLPGHSTSAPQVQLCDVLQVGV